MYTNEQIKLAFYNLGVQHALENEDFTKHANAAKAGKNVLENIARVYGAGMGSIALPNLTQEIMHSPAARDLMGHLDREFLYSSGLALPTAGLGALGGLGLTNKLLKTLNKGARKSINLGNLHIPLPVGA
mgnify:CR=1 FL=1